MSVALQESVRIRAANITHNNTGIEVLTKSLEIYNKFDELVSKTFPKDVWRPFRQGDSEAIGQSSNWKWLYFEFWITPENRKTTDPILMENAEKIAKALGIPLDLV